MNKPSERGSSCFGLGLGSKNRFSADIRPPDYAARFVRLAVEGSALETAVAVVAVARPPWLTGLLAEYGVVESRLADTVRLFAGG